jgi:hypothetical protein
VSAELEFAELHRRTVAWAERESARIVRIGVPLAEPEMAIAKSVGVRHPERVRILFVASVPFPEDRVVRATAESVNMNIQNTLGFALNYGIFIREDQRRNRKLLAHELRHVSHYECAGSISVFMDHYLRELLHYGYGPGPFDIDAEVASLKYA